MGRLRLLFSASLLSSLTAWSAAALADVPPEDACSSSAKAGSTCNVAGPNFDMPGTCQSSTCMHVGPGADGGITTSSYPCMLCMEGSSSSGGGSTSASAGSTSTGISSAGDASSCSVGAVGREGAITGTMMLVGLAALLADRRSRGSAGPRPRRRS
jgi:hypothetical protein